MQCEYFKDIYIFLISGKTCQVVTEYLQNFQKNALMKIFPSLRQNKTKPAVLCNVMTLSVVLNIRNKITSLKEGNFLKNVFQQTILQCLVTTRLLKDIYCKNV